MLCWNLWVAQNNSSWEITQEEECVFSVWCIRECIFITHFAWKPSKNLGRIWINGIQCTFINTVLFGSCVTTKKIEITRKSPSFQGGSVLSYTESRCRSYFVESSPCWWDLRSHLQAFTELNPPICVQCVCACVRVCVHVRLISLSFLRREWEECLGAWGGTCERWGGCELGCQGNHCIGLPCDWCCWYEHVSAISVIIQHLRHERSHRTQTHTAQRSLLCSL